MSLEDDGVDCAIGGYYQTDRVRGAIYRITADSTSSLIRARLLDKKTGRDLGPVQILTPRELSSVPGNELPEWTKVKP